MVILHYPVLFTVVHKLHYTFILSSLHSTLISSSLLSSSPFSLILLPSPSLLLFLFLFLSSISLSPHSFLHSLHLTLRSLLFFSTPHSFPFLITFFFHFILLSYPLHLHSSLSTSFQSLFLLLSIYSHLFPYLIFHF